MCAVGFEPETFCIVVYWYYHLAIAAQGGTTTSIPNSIPELTHALLFIIKLHLGMPDWKTETSRVEDCPRSSEKASNTAGRIWSYYYNNCDVLKSTLDLQGATVALFANSKVIIGL